jgi:cell cycle checkpoint control protein RAD9A
MATLSFSLEPPALFRLHDALVCLTKFNESVSIEAEYDMVIRSRGPLFAWG